MLNPWYVTGLIDGAGSFTFSRTSGGHMNLILAMKFAPSDRQLADEVRAFFGFAGSIYEIQPRAVRGKPQDPQTKATLYYRVTRQDEIPDIMRHFDAYPLVGRKASSYRIWRQMADLKRHPREARLGALADLADQLTRINTRKSS